MHAPAVHFKGSGFYNTDYGTKKRQRENDKAAESGADKHDAKTADKGSDGGGDKKDSGSATKTDAKPAAATSSGSKPDS